MKLMGWEMLGDGCWVMGVDDVWDWMLGDGCWMLDVGCWVLGVDDVWDWMLGVGWWMLSVDDMRDLMLDDDDVWIYNELYRNH